MVERVKIRLSCPVGFARKMKEKRQKQSLGSIEND